MVIYMNLGRLGFSRSTYSEVIFTVRLKEMVNAAPMGVLLNDEEEIYLRVYKGQRTYDMIVNGAEDCVLNITDDPRLFYYAIFEKEKISYHPAKRVSSPRICGCDAYVECSITEVTRHEEYVKVFLKPLLIAVTERTVSAYNRAGPAIIEALICYTRLLYFKDADRGKAESLKKRIIIFKDIVYHSTEDSRLRKIATKILEQAEAL
ncbi:TPA: DUF447 family protein [Candidatus Bathyarchaeota archaeon]|nr:DUF447 family protein [Candidatus Bathyarchaeota archaeon]